MKKLLTILAFIASTTAALATPKVYVVDMDLATYYDGTAWTDKAHAKLYENKEAHLIMLQLRRDGNRNAGLEKVEAQ